MSEIIKDYPVIIEMPIRWGDMDAMRHVNNTLYFRYFESVRIAYMAKIDLYKSLNKQGDGLILASTSCKFKVPLTYPDTISVCTKVVNIKEHSFTFKLSIVSHKLNKEVAEGEAVMVWYNYKEKKKGLIPEVIKENILKIEETKDS